jgi:hypothetical protein
MGIRNYSRHSVTAVAIAGLMVSAAGCNGDSNADPNPLPSSSGSGAPASSPTTSPTSSPTGWESEFTVEQLAAYQEALGRWQDYERESGSVWANPKPTAETLKFFAGYFYNEDLIQNRLEQYAEAEVKVEGLPNVLWSKAILAKGQTVHIRQCVDYTTLTVTQHDQPVEGSAEPLVREIDLSVPADESVYLIEQIQDVAWGAEEERCKA